MDLTIFVAIGDPADSGLDGTLALCVVPNNSTWQDVSIFHRYQELPRIYITYDFTETDGLYYGTLEFADDIDTIEGMTLGGQSIVQDQIYLSDSTSVYLNDTVNPFIQIDLEQLSFKDVLLQTNQIYVKKFNTSIKIIPGSAATHMPTSIYDYMEENFFSYLCVQPGDDDNNISQTSNAVPLKNCQCNGNNYYGMPNIEFSLQLGQYDTQYSYMLEPYQFEMLPKVDQNIRSTMCNLGLWNLQETESKHFIQDRDENEFAVA